ncbi:MAG: murein transglycosylase A [Candidatus Binatia bacterium]|nr:murein transglycosylase A [Candidatus Binatia bacterium]
MTTQRKGKWSEQERWGVPCPVLALSLFLLSGGCHPPSQTQLVPVSPSEMPVLRDDLDRASLQTAVRHSLSALHRQNASSTLAFGTERISVAHLRASLETFLAIIETEGEPAPRLARELQFYRVTTPVLFTGYYEPLLNGSLTPTARYRYPLYRRPDDLIEVDLAAFPSACSSTKLYGRVEQGKLLPYFSRAEIDGQGVLAGKGYELVWVDDAVARFFLHIQGSGQIALPDGTRLRVGYAGTNGNPYTSIGSVLLRQGKLRPGHTSAADIQRYLYDHPAERDQLLFHNPRYVFFRFVADGPHGSLGVPLTPGRSLAVDPTIYPLGALAFLRTSKPVLAPDGHVTWQQFSRFVLFQDSGAAITGWNRADLFWGSEAATEAGYMAREGELYLLLKHR